MTQLLVSVRTAAEAEIALKGGAAIVDVKEPGNGPLGKAPDCTITLVAQAVAGRVAVSAAMGELHRGLPASLPQGVGYLKWGLAGMGAQDWRSAIRRAAQMSRELAP